MNARFFDLKDSISVVGFISTLKLACNRNNIQERAAMWALPHPVNEMLENELNGRMYVKDRLSPFVASVRNEETRSRKLLRSHPEAVNYLLKKFATDHTLQRIMQQFSVT